MQLLREGSHFKQWAAYAAYLLSLCGALQTAITATPALADDTIFNLL